MPNDVYISRTAQLTSRRCILNIYSADTLTEHFKHAAHSPSFSLQDAVYFIMLSFLVPAIFTFLIQDVLKFYRKSGAKGLRAKMNLFLLLRRPLGHRKEFKSTSLINVLENNFSVHVFRIIYFRL